MRKKVDLIWLGISIGSYLLLSISFLIMPLGVPGEDYAVMSILPGVLFWVSLILGLVSQVVLGNRRAKWFELQGVRRHTVRKGKIGLIRFWQNIPAKIADVVFVVSLIAFLVATKTTHGIGYICYVLLATCVFSFCSHCIFNGKIYEYITKQEKIKILKEEA